MTFDDILKQALEETAHERVKQMLREEPQPKLSLSFRLWERKTLRDFRKKHRIDSRLTVRKTRRITAAVAVAALALILTACAAAGLAIGRYFLDDKREYSRLYITRSPSDKTRFEEYYALPEENGWEITQYDEMKHSIMISYVNGDAKVNMSQNIIDDNMPYVNTEKAIVEPISLHEKDDGFFITTQGGSSLLYLTYNGYLFTFHSNLNKEDLLELANLIRISKYKAPDK